MFDTLAMIEIHIGILVLLGVGVLGGALGAWFFQKIRVPQVVGYIAFGILVGKSGLKILDGGSSAFSSAVNCNSKHLKNTANNSPRSYSGKDWRPFFWSPPHRSG
ncbi:MAG: hypothetical protein ACYTER_11435 [Planctomycetota bacterium]|jgi:hypothetical protein